MLIGQAFVETGFLTCQAITFVGNADLPYRPVKCRGRSCACPRRATTRVAPTTNKRPRGYRFPNCTYNNQSRHRRGWVFQPIGRGDLAPTIVIFLKSRHTSYAVTPNSTGKMGNFSNHVSRITVQPLSIQRIYREKTVSYIDASINTRWHLDKKNGGHPDKIGAYPKSDRNRVFSQTRFL